MSYATGDPSTSQPKLKDALAVELARFSNPILTERERQILHLLNKGRSAAEIAKIFHSSQDEIQAQIVRLQPKIADSSSDKRISRHALMEIFRFFEPG